VLGPGPLWRERRRYVAGLVVKSLTAAKTLEVLRDDRDPLCRVLSRTARLVIDVDPQRL